MSLDPEDANFLARAISRDVAKQLRATPPDFWFVWGCVWRVFLSLLLLGPVIGGIVGAAAYIAASVLKAHGAQ